MSNEYAGLKINIKPNTPPEIGADTQNTLMDNIIGAVQVGGLDISSIDALTQCAQNREQTYQLIDSMAQDSRISAVLECYAGDIVQPNDSGKIVWAEAENGRISEFVNWLLETLNVDKHIYRWAYCLVTYGDVYLRLFRQSDIQDDLLFKVPTSKKLNEDAGPSLQEDVKLRVYSASDKYIPYVKMVDNPGEMFDLQKFGKTHGFVKAPPAVASYSTDALYSYLVRYKMKQSDVEVYDALSFVHGCLESTNQRQPETVDIFLDAYAAEGQENSDSMTSSYDVKRGQSLLYNSFRIWRELSLLEMSALLNRLTRSAVVRILNIDVGDMPKHQVEAYLSKLKSKIEQKAALNTGDPGSMKEYNVNGPIENTIYVPTHEGKGAINASTIGGDFDPKSLVDLEYFKNMLYGSLRAPKQFFCETDDGAGFNGGSSLTIISARYGKEIKKDQKVLCQMITDLVNLFLIDRGLDNWVNKFTIRMQAPITQEVLDRRADNDTRLRYINDIMTQLDMIEDPVIKLKVYRTLISQVINDPRVVNIIQDYIDDLEKKRKAEATPEEMSPEEPLNDLGEITTAPEATENSLVTPEEELPSLSEVETPEAPAQESFGEDFDKEVLNEAQAEEDEKLPSPEDLDINFLDAE